MSSFYHLLFGAISLHASLFQFASADSSSSGDVCSNTFASTQWNATGEYQNTSPLDSTKSWTWRTGLTSHPSSGRVTQAFWVDTQNGPNLNDLDTKSSEVCVGIFRFDNETLFERARNDDGSGTAMIGQTCLDLIDVESTSCDFDSSRIHASDECKDIITNFSYLAFPISGRMLNSTNSTCPSTMGNENAASVFTTIVSDKIDTSNSSQFDEVYDSMAKRAYLFVVNGWVTEQHTDGTEGNSTSGISFKMVLRNSDFAEGARVPEGWEESNEDGDGDGDGNGNGDGNGSGDKPNAASALGGSMLAWSVVGIVIAIVFV